MKYQWELREEAGGMIFALRKGCWVVSEGRDEREARFHGLRQECK